MIKMISKYKKVQTLFEKFSHLTKVLILLVGLMGTSCNETKESLKEIIVAQNHPQASDEGLGTSKHPLKTISRAVELAVPGSTILVHEGIYRELVAPVTGGNADAPITFKAVPGEEVIISAADTWNPEWTHVTGNVYKAKVEDDIFKGNMDHYNPFETKMDLRTRHKDHTVTGIPCYKDGYEIDLTLGQVVVNGDLFMEVSSLSPSVYNYENTWKYSSEEKCIYIHFTNGVIPENQKIEITTRRQCFAPEVRGLGYINVQGFIMKYAGNQHPGAFWIMTENKQAGALSTKSGHHWIIEDNIIKHNKSIGIDFGNEGVVEGLSIPRDSVRNHIIRNNIISDNGIGGIMGAGSRGVVIEGNLIQNNNTLKMHSWEVGGIKTHFFNGIIRNNIVVDNHCYGVWLDNDYTGARVTQNIIHNNSDRGIFLEMGKGPAIIDNNIISSTNIGASGEGKKFYGDGIYAHDAGGFIISNNIIFDNEGFGISMRTLPGRALPTENIKIVNNYILDNKEGAVNIPFDGIYANNNYCENNVFSGDEKFILSTWGEKMENFGSQLINIKNAVQKKFPGSHFDEWSSSSRPEGVILSFAQWQNVMNWDTKSQTNIITDMQIDENLVMKFILESDPSDLIWIPQEGIKEDLFGHKYNNDVYIGPFQNIKKGENQIQLIQKLGIGLVYVNNF